MNAIYRTFAIATLATLTTFGASAHDGAHPDAPNPSSNATLSQEVGYTKVLMSFGRPGVKGRTIWGELVPFNGGDPRPWVAGANGSTTVEFADDVLLDGHALPAGKYGLHIIPSAEEWIFIFNKDSSRFGIMKYKSDTDALRLTVKAKEAAYQEWMVYEISKTGEFTATLNLHWEKLSAGFTIEAPDHRKEKAARTGKH